MKIDGRVALVTGGAAGIGAATARLLAAADARVVIVDRDADGANAVAAEMDGLAVVADVTDPATMDAAVAAAECRYGCVDMVLLNAGTMSGQSGYEDLDLAGYRRAIGVNVDHVVFGLVAALPALRRAGGGAVVVTASLAGLTPMVGDPLYTLTKHAVVGYVRAVAPALAAERITVAAVCPGFTDTELIAGIAGPQVGLPLLPASEVARAVRAVVEGAAPGECWYVQPGRDASPYGFRGVPGPARGTGEHSTT